jgi:HD-GYP domain-containing protein (c-di-GMP phosphodiesterase class II)
MSQYTDKLLKGLADAVDARDTYIGGHSRRVATYTKRILHALNITQADTMLIVTAARVHDIGKLYVPDAILHKAGPLTAEEWETMKAHAAHGAEFLARHADFQPYAELVRHHHERIDGKGYPSGLCGDAIPLGARVIAVADSYDAMTSDRPYRRGMPPTQATQILHEGRGTQWDPLIVDALLQWIANPSERPMITHKRLTPQWLRRPLNAAL